MAALSREDGAIDLLERAGHALADAVAAGGGRVVTASAGEPSGATVVAAIHQRDAVEALAVALLERDRYTGEHSESVVEMSAGVARALGLSPSQVEVVRSAALLHDIGKVGIPDAILHKPGPLTPEEREVMAEHPLIGERILRSIGGFGAVADIVRHEHESFDGGGYPDGIEGDEIPIGSRIILACDAYHAMTSDRPVPQAHVARRGVRRAEALRRQPVRPRRHGGPDRPPVLRAGRPPRRRGLRRDGTRRSATRASSPCGSGGLEARSEPRGMLRCSSCWRLVVDSIICIPSGENVALVVDAAARAAGSS